MSPEQNRPVVSASGIAGRLDADGFPDELQWQTAKSLRFELDWQGKNADPERATEVRLLWSPYAFFIKFVARYRTITVFADSEANGRRDKLWDRDVAEVFLQPDDFDIWRYKEFEVSPNGMWIDLDVSHGTISNLQSGLRRRVAVDEREKNWTAELAIPMKALDGAFHPAKSWRINLFRIEGEAEPRFYSAWRPTYTPAPNFHVPEAFAMLIFVPAAATPES